MAEQENRPRLTKEEREKKQAQYTQRKLDRASQYDAFVTNPQGGESRVFYALGSSIDFLFRTSRRQEFRLDVVSLDEMEAKLEYKKALVGFMDSMRGIAKKMGKKFEEHAIIKEFRKKIPQEEAILSQLKTPTYVAPSSAPVETEINAVATEVEQEKKTEEKKPKK